MSEGELSIVGLLIHWAPMLLLIGAWIFFMSRMRGPAEDYASLQQELLQVHREVRDELREIKTVLKDRKP